jgi:hypothetical protein
MAKRRRLQDLTPGEISRITQKAALMEAEYLHRHRHLNDEDTMTLKMLSIMTAAEGLLEMDGGRPSLRIESPFPDSDL